MSEFKTITTQEEFDAAIGDRLKRERDTVKKSYEGYMSPDDVAKKYAGYLSPEDEAKKYRGYLSPEEVAKKDASIRAYETNSVKMRIAHETGIPYELAGRLSGEKEEDIRKDAEALAKLINAGTPAPPLASTERGVSGNENRAAIKGMLDNLKGE